jgi:hypothetical protein
LHIATLFTKIKIAVKEKLFLLIFLSTIYYRSDSQDLKYARHLIDTLSSVTFSGRGYDAGDDGKAAELIEKELKKNKIKKFGKSYFQTVPVSVNTFQGEYDLKIGNSNLAPGKDFLFESSSCSLSGKFPIILINAQFLKDSPKMDSLLKIDISGKFLMFDTLGLHDKNFGMKYTQLIKENALNAKGIIEISDKPLIYEPAQKSGNFVGAVCLRSAIPANFDSVNVYLKNKELADYLSQNIIGFRKGKIDSFIVFTAHYDHLGKIGTTAFFPGANDNASGVSMVLDLSRYFSKLKKKPKYRIAFIFFTGEELGLLGSKYFTENPMFPLSKIKFLVNLDMVGSGDKGIQIVNSTVFKKEFAMIDGINNEKKYLPVIKKRGAAANSDHYFFYEKGVKSFFIYTLGEYKEYHNISDKSAGLPLSKYENLFRLLTEFTECLEK